MRLPSLVEIEAAAAVIGPQILPTPQYLWPLLAEVVGCEVWVKHENHTPIGAFKVRGGIQYLHRLRAEGRSPAGLISATRGNHGQSLARAARAANMPLTIVVPFGNSHEKNVAMRAFGATLIEHGEDFEAARLYAQILSVERNLEMVPAFHFDLVTGVATYALELFRAVKDLSTVYVAIGMGSGICGLIAVRDALKLSTEIVGVVATGAPAYALSLAAGHIVSTERAETIADGVACRVPSVDAFEIIQRGAARVLQVSDAEIIDAMKAFYTATHNLAEGAGAAGLAGLLQEREGQRAKRCAVILSGGNVDRERFLQYLAN